MREREMGKDGVRPAQMQETHPGKEHEMDPIPRHKRPSYKPAGKLQVRQDNSSVHGFTVGFSP